jgi:hypothetical protein
MIGVPQKIVLNYKEIYKMEIPAIGGDLIFIGLPKLLFP